MSSEVKVDVVASAKKISQDYLHQVIWDCNVIKFDGQFKLKSHQRDPKKEVSPYYYSFREKDLVVSSHPEGPMSPFQRLMHLGAFGIYLNHRQLFLEKKVDFVVGAPVAANYLAAAFEPFTKVPFLEIQKEVKTGRRLITDRILGDFKKGQRVLLVDDVLTSGDSLLEAVDSIRQNGLRIAGIGVIVDRQEGGLERLKRHPLLKRISRHIDAVTTTENILAGQHPEVLEYAKRQREGNRSL